LFEEFKLSYVMGGAMSRLLYPFSESLSWWKLNCYFVFVTCELFAFGNIKIALFLKYGCYVYYIVGFKVKIIDKVMMKFIHQKDLIHTHFVLFALHKINEKLNWNYVEYDAIIRKLE